MASAMLLVTAATARDTADAPASSARLAGIYKVASSNDPLFPATSTQEIFLDFGRGLQSGVASGSVAISLRQNPNVKVRIMAWQYFADQRSIVIGNPYAEGSRNAVAAGVWRMQGNSASAVFARGNYQVVLHRAEPKDY